MREFSERFPCPRRALEHCDAPALGRVSLRGVVPNAVHTVMDEDPISKVFGCPRYRQIIDRQPVRFGADAEHNDWSSIVAYYIC